MAKSELGLILQCAKVVKRDITVAFTNSAHCFRAQYICFNLEPRRVWVDVIISVRQDCKNLFIAIFIVISIFDLLFNKYFAKINVTVFLHTIRGISWYKFYFKVCDNYCLARLMKNAKFEEIFLIEFFRNVVFAKYNLCALSHRYIWPMIIIY